MNSTTTIEQLRDSTKAALDAADASLMAVRTAHSKACNGVPLAIDPLLAMIGEARDLRDHLNTLLGAVEQTLALTQ